jgi:dTDP-4-amino-4,6-dideoxygalactose transaminase
VANHKGIPFHQPLFVGEELNIIADVRNRGKFSGNGYYTNKSATFLKSIVGFKSCLLTHSCTGALELAALLMEIKLGDEVILPAYTFVSTANPFLLRGAKLVFVDSSADHPNLDVNLVEQLITPKTKAIVAVHYAGCMCDMSSLRKLCDQYDLFLVEDAAQAIGSFDELGNHAGVLSDFAAFSFHDSKLIHCGEGGALVVNHPDFIEKAEICWEKGTNRSAYLRGDVTHYEWKSIGSSFLMAELNAAFLWAQLQFLDDVIKRQKEIWNHYYTLLTQQNNFFTLPPKSACGNGYIFYLLLDEQVNRDEFIDYMLHHHIETPFHYQNLAKSKVVNVLTALPNTDKFARQLVRLPLYNSISKEEQVLVCKTIQAYKV